jgi:ATP-dependent Lon protease
VIELPGYTLEEKLEIAQRFLLPRQVERNGLSGLADFRFEVTEGALRRIVESYTREAGVRNLERQISALCRKTARKLAEAEAGEITSVCVDAQDLDDLLGPVSYEPEAAEAQGRSGVAVGLAWTPAGGDILFIEATKMSGQGELKLTGSLGDVMRESVEAARSWVRGQNGALDIDAVSFENSDIHVHVPSGAVPKDGPSAGVAMVTSLVSLMTERPALSRVAMTGEITLRGKILPVGGIKEKVLAAKRAGIEHVVLPAPNRKDVAEIPAALVEGLELSYVETIDEALAHTLEPVAG